MTVFSFAIPSTTSFPIMPECPQIQASSIWHMSLADTRNTWDRKEEHKIEIFFSHDRAPYFNGNTSFLCPTFRFKNILTSGQSPKSIFQTIFFHEK